MYCRNCGQELSEGVNFCFNCGYKAGEGSDFCSNCGVKVNGEEKCINCGYESETIIIEDKKENYNTNDGQNYDNYQNASNNGYPNNNGYQNNNRVGKSKIAAGILGILVGGLGIHRFYLGYVGLGILQIFVTLITCGAGSLWGFIEGILILCGTGITVDANGNPLSDN